MTGWRGRSGRAIHGARSNTNHADQRDRGHGADQLEPSRWVELLERALDPASPRLVGSDIRLHAPSVAAWARGVCKQTSRDSAGDNRNLSLRGEFPIIRKLLSSISYINVRTQARKGRLPHYG